VLGGRSSEPLLLLTARVPGCACWLDEKEAEEAQELRSAVISAEPRLSLGPVLGHGGSNKGPDSDIALILERCPMLLGGFGDATPQLLQGRYL